MLQILPWSLKSVPLAEASHHTVNTLKLPCREACMKRSWPAPTCAWVTRKWILLPQSNLQVTAIQADTFFSNWRIIALQYCVGFCHTSTWISHKHIYIRFLPLEPPLANILTAWAQTSSQAAPKLLTRRHYVRYGSCCFKPQNFESNVVYSNMAN